MRRGLQIPLTLRVLTGDCPVPGIGGAVYALPVCHLGGCLLSEQETARSPSRDAPMGRPPRLAAGCE